MDYSDIHDYFTADIIPWLFGASNVPKIKPQREGFPDNERCFVNSDNKKQILFYKIEQQGTVILLKYDASLSIEVNERRLQKRFHELTVAYFN